LAFAFAESCGTLKGAARTTLVIPPLRIGGIALDLSFLVVIILVQILAYIALDLARRS